MHQFSEKNHTIKFLLLFYNNFAGDHVKYSAKLQKSAREPVLTTNSLLRKIARATRRGGREVMN
jgi:hypothetical protein